MNLEIERKFLVKGEYKQSASKSYHIIQAYIPTLTGITVRIRIKGDKGFITIKGKSTHSGLSRYEWEKEIPLNDAQELLTLCLPGMIDKTRYEVEFENQTYEVDEFYGENEGLTIAELEFESETASYSKPKWLGEEVTGDKRYSNSYLSQHPFKHWKS